jgi:transcriptional regulator with XRE-family HTH domain
MKLYRQALGEVLREARTVRGQTLRQVSTAASCALGYLSELENGHKEASSEILEGLARALKVTVSELAIRAGLRIAEESIPDTPAELYEEAPALIPHRG